MHACSEAKENTIVLLPNFDINIATSFTVKHPVHFKGRPGTCMIFRNTHLTIDFGDNSSRYAAEGEDGIVPWVVFSEVQFIFKIDLKRVGEVLTQ